MGDWAGLLKIRENAYVIGALQRQLGTPLGVIPFVGAGLSHPFGYPLWTDFLVQQALLAGISHQIRDRLAEGQYEEAAADLLIARKARRFDDAVMSTFGPDSLSTLRPESAVSLLTNLPESPR